MSQEVHTLAEQQFTTEELQSEEWRDIPDFEGYYQVSNLGRVRTLRTSGLAYVGRILRPATKKRGLPYIQVHLYRGSKKSGKVMTVHILVARAFLGPRPQGLEINHIDNDPANCRASNLEYVTHQQNIAHAARQGRMNQPYRPRPELQSENGPTARLTNQDVINIRKAILDGISGAALAKHYNVTDMTISQIKRGKNWKFVIPYRDEVAALGSNKTLHRIPRRCGRANYSDPPVPKS